MADRPFWSRLTTVRDHEWRPTLLAAAYFFCVLCGYYVLRPLREEMGLAGGVRNLRWLFLGTLAGTLLITPLFGAVVNRFRRPGSIVVTLRFFVLNLAVFFGLLKTLPASADVVLGRVFYVWLSVFNMFVVSLFWAFMADGFRLGESKRVFGVLAVGGTVGAIAGSALTSTLVEPLGRVNLLLVSMVFLEAAVWVVRWLDRAFLRLAAQRAPDEAPSPPVRYGGALAGIRLTLQSGYLRTISGYLFLYSLTATVLYFAQAYIVDAAVPDRIGRAELFANIDLWVNVLTLLTQVFLTGRILRILGIGWSLAVIPFAVAGGLAVLGATPTLVVLVVLQVLRRAGNYAFARPARETLFTVVTPEEKYKAKSFVDTFVYRGGDVLGASLFDLAAASLALSGTLWAAVPVALAWGGTGLYLGRRQRTMQPPEPRGDSP